MEHMIGLGTMVNTAAIVAGGLAGLGAGRLLKARMQETVVKALGFATMVMALGGVFAQMLTADLPVAAGRAVGRLEVWGTMMMILSLALGALLGEWIDLDRQFARFGAWLRDRTGNQGDAGFIDAFVTCTLTVCVGAMAILGSIQDGLQGDPTTLYAKSLLDLMIVLMMTASMGKGCIFSAIPVAILQGSVTLLARQAASVMTDAAVRNLSLVGNVLIFCVGVNLIWPKTIRVANLLPALVIAVLFAFLE